MNRGGQGWSGSFSLDKEGTEVLRDGRYVTVGGGRILDGTFDPAGDALPTSLPHAP